MAEGWARTLLGKSIEVYSAGIEPKGVDPRAVTVMAEAGVDISGHRSKHLDELGEVVFDLVVTVCDNANERCPLFPGQARRHHKAFEDPPRLASDAGSENEAIGHYRRIREEIRQFVQTLPDLLGDDIESEAAR
jgi:arsenate reductase